MDIFDRPLRYAKKIWHDAVWSKVIGGLILAPLLAILGWIAYRLQDVYWTSVPLWIFLTVTLLLLTTSIIFMGLWLKVRSSSVADIIDGTVTTEVEFQLRDIEIRMLVELFKATERRSQNEIAQTLGIELPGTAKYHLQRLKDQEFITFWSPSVRLSHHGSTGYAIEQKGREYVIERNLLTSQGRFEASRESKASRTLPK